MKIKIHTDETLNTQKIKSGKVNIRVTPDPDIFHFLNPELPRPRDCKLESKLGYRVSSRPV